MRPIRPEDVQRTHAVDTLGALARDVAHPVATFYRELRKEGMDRDDARHFTRAFMHKLFGDIDRTKSG